MKTNKKSVLQIITIIGTVILCFLLNMYRNNVYFAADKELRRGSFVIIDETPDFQPADSICYNPGGSKGQKSETEMFNTSNFITEHVYSKESETESIGAFWAVKKDFVEDTLVFQFEAYTDSEPCDLDVFVSNINRTVQIDSEKKMFFLKYQDIEKIGDIIFSVTDPKSNVTIKSMYLVSYPSYYNPEDIFEGTIVCEN